MNKQYNSFDDFKNLVSKHPEIKSRTEFKKKFPAIYGRFIVLKQMGEITEDFPIESKRKNYTTTNLKYKTLSDFQNYVNENNIHSRKEFISLNKPLYRRGTRLKLTKKLIYIDGSIPGSLFDSIEKIQKFIIDNKIISKIDLKRRYLNIYRAYLKLRKETDKDIVFEEEAVESSYERLFLDYLVKNNIPMKTKYEVYYNNSTYRFDFVNHEYKLIVEIHGEQHFNLNLPEEAWGDKRDERAVDIRKKKIAESLGFKILYFAFCKNEYEKYGYFDKVYTNIDDFIILLKSLIPVDYNYKNEFSKIQVENYIDDSQDSEITSLEIKTIDDLSRVLQDYKISSPSEFIEKFPKLYEKAEKLKWIRKLYYYKNDPIGDIKNYRNLNDVQTLVDNLKIKSLREFRKLCLKVYYKAWKYKWLDKIIYYVEKTERSD